MKQTVCYEAIVIGAGGGVGSAALFELARRGVRTLGVEQFQPAHNRGSSHGQTRICRQAYFEHPDYVPLLLRAYQRWDALGERIGRRLFEPIGLLQIGPEEGRVLAGVSTSASRFGLDVERLTADEIARRWPQLRIPHDGAGLFEPAAGYLLVEECVAAHVTEAQRLGAELIADTTVRGWRVDGRQVVVDADAGEFRGDRLVLATGAYDRELLAELKIPLSLRRKPQYWFAADKNRFTPDRCPAFLYDLAEGVFYGLPDLGRGVKLARHTGGEPLNDSRRLDRSIDEDDLRQVLRFAANWLEGVSPRLLDHSMCVYNLTPDEHFIVDRHPEHEQVVFATGLSGHGFKFTGVLGEALAELAIDGRTEAPIDFLRLDRPTLRPHGD